MNLKKIVILLLAGILALSFVLPVAAQTTTEASQPVAADDELAVSGEAWVRQNQEASPDDEATVNQNEDQAAQAVQPDAGAAASEENGQQ